jgi:hypothetical protein
MSMRWTGFSECYKNAWPIIPLALAGALSGCSHRPPAGTVTGTVRYKGEIVPAGKVTFFGPSNQAASAPINPDGTYTATDVPLGSVKVIVNTLRPTAELKKAAKQMKKRFGKGNEYPESSDAVSVPEKYGDPAKSPLSLTVKEGSQPYDIEMK